MFVFINSRFITKFKKSIPFSKVMGGKNLKFFIILVLFVICNHSAFAATFSRDWSTPVNIVEYWPTPEEQAHSITADNEDNWHIVYSDTEYGSDNGQTIYYTYIKYANKFSNPVIIASDIYTYGGLSESGGKVYAPSVDTDANGGLHVSYNSWDYVSPPKIMYTYKSGNMCIPLEINGPNYKKFDVFEISIAYILCIPSILSLRESLRENKSNMIGKL